MPSNADPILLTVGAGQLDRVIADAGELLQRYRVDTGTGYLDYTPITSRDQLFPEDIAITLLVNSQAGWRAVRSLCHFGALVDLTVLPNKSLEQTTPEERQIVAQLIARMAQWPGFGAYMNPAWPERLAPTDTIKDESRVRRALDWSTFDLTRADNAPVWERLLDLEPKRTRIQLFDSIWWMYFRTQQPVHTHDSTVAGVLPIR